MEVTFEQRQEAREGVCHRDILEENIPGRGNSH